MEILSNFISIYCSISFIVGEMFMLAILSIVAMGKAKEPKVHFYIKRVYNSLELWMKDRYGILHFVLPMKLGDDYLIDTESFRYMEHDEIREINLM